MGVLLVTGKLAEARVKEIAAKYDCRVYVAPVDVASLLTPKQIVSNITLDEDVDSILVPGLIRGNLAILEEKIGVPVFKGPKDVADLDYVLERRPQLELSKTTPACELLRGELRKRALAEITKVDSKEYIEGMLNKPGNILVGGLAVGKSFPIRVLAEIVGIEDLSKEELLTQGRYLLASGADMIDLGINEVNPEKVEHSISALRELGIPIAVDTMEAENIQRALECGVDLVLSFDRELIEGFRDVVVASVVIPKRGDIPRVPEERVRLLEENIQLARERGFQRIIADLVLQPANLGFSDSLAAYKKFSEKHKEYPVLFGAGNVTELFDADSVGVNALLCALAMECGASIVFSVEASDKTRGSIRELATTSKMMYISSLRGSPPKDLGFDLLILKEKRLKRNRMKLDIRKLPVKPGKGFVPDPKGYFKIFVDEKIQCVHFVDGEAMLCIEGASAREICDTLLALDLVSTLEHALYLGRELKKAESALRYGKSYVQE
ncbi:MAG: dihydropteroate synthase-like protein [Candidatus Hydrothermarchaeales archaeon]